MNIVSGIVLYILLWWWVLFMVLPFYSKASNKPDYGHDRGAPDKPFLKIKIILTTFISLILWLICFYIISIGLISFREL